MAGQPNLSRRRRAFVVLGGVGLFALAASRAPVAADPMQCAAMLRPDTVTIGAEPVTISYMLADSVGTVGSITADEGSGLQVRGFNPQESTLELNTANGIPGSWTLRFTGEEQRTCTGMITVKTPTGRTR